MSPIMNSHSLYKQMPKKQISYCIIQNKTKGVFFQLVGKYFFMTAAGSTMVRSWVCLASYDKA